MLVDREAKRTGGDVFWIEPRHILDRIAINWPVVSDAAILPGSLAIDGRTVPLNDISGVFVRCPWPLPLRLEDMSLEDRDYVVKETSAAWLALLSALPCAVVNRPIPGGRPALLAGNPDQRRIVAEHGFLLSPSRCTSSQADALAHYSAWQGRAYVKPLGTDECGADLHPMNGVEQICQIMEQYAVALQAVPFGQRITAYVAGGRVVATVVQSDGRKSEAAELPFLPTEQFGVLVKALGMSFAECHFVVTPEGQAFCLDVSGSPNYWRCPRDVQQVIVQRLVESLSELRSVAVHDSLDGAPGRSGAGERLR